MQANDLDNSSAEAAPLNWNAVKSKLRELAQVDLDLDLEGAHENYARQLREIAKQILAVNTEESPEDGELSTLFQRAAKNFYVAEEAWALETSAKINGRR